MYFYDALIASEDQTLMENKNDQFQPRVPFTELNCEQWFASFIRLQGKQIISSAYVYN